MVNNTQLYMSCITITSTSSTLLCSSWFLFALLFDYRTTYIVIIIIIITNGRVLLILLLCVVYCKIINNSIISIMSRTSKLLLLLVNCSQVILFMPFDVSLFYRITYNIMIIIIMNGSTIQLYRSICYSESYITY